MFEHTTQLRRPTTDHSNGDTHSEKEQLKGLIQRLRNEELFASVGVSCANCNKMPSEITEWWICRDCLDVILDPVCLAERREDVCPSDHTHLRLTLRDVQDCRSRNGERAQHAEKWLNQIKQDWGLDKPSLRTFDDVLTLTLGVMAAKRFWKEKKYGRNSTQYTSSPSIPLAELTKRVDIAEFKGPGDPVYLKEIHASEQSESVGQ